jgi:hypothetical protein
MMRSGERTARRTQLNGSESLLQPPPSAFSSATLAASERFVMSRQARSALNEAFWAETTLR